MTTSDIVFDLDGVVYRGDRPIPGAGESLHQIETAGIGIWFATNNSSQPGARVASKISSVTGFAALPSQVITSADATAAFLADSVDCVFVVGGDGLRQALLGAGLEIVEDWQDADAVAVGLDREVTYDKLKHATLAIRQGARFIASNTDASFPAADGLWPGAGSLVAALETASGRKAEVAGKPHPPMRRLIQSKVGSGAIWMVGDRPETDLAMAESEGWTSVLVLTGVTPSGDGIRPDPDHVLDSIAALPKLLSDESG